MKRFALGTIFACMLVIAAGYASAFLPGGPPAIAAWAFALATAALMVAVLVLGAAQRGSSLGALRWVFAFVFVVLAAGFCLALLAPAVTGDAKLWLGLPQGAATILYIVGLLPLLVLPLAYALTFDKTLGADDLEDLRRRLAELQSTP